MSRFYFYCILITAICLGSCKRDKPDPDKPIINVVNPQEGDHLTEGQLIYLQGTFSDKQLSECIIKVIRDSNGSQVYFAAPDIKGKSTYTFNLPWTPSVYSVNTNYTLDLWVKDESGNTQTLSIHFHTHP